MPTLHNGNEVMRMGKNTQMSEKREANYKLQKINNVVYVAAFFLWAMNKTHFLQKMENMKIFARGY